MTCIVGYQEERIDDKYVKVPKFVDDTSINLIKVGNQCLEQVINAYDAKVKELIEEEKKEEQERKSKSYDNLWIHSFKKEVEELDKEFKVEFMTKEAFMDEKSYSRLWVQVEYKGKKIDVQRNDGRFEWNTHNVDSEFKNKWSKKVESFIKQVKEVVEAKEKSDQWKKEAEEKNTNEVQNTVKELSEIFGREIKHEVEESGYRDYRGRWMPSKHDKYSCEGINVTLRDYREDGQQVIIQGMNFKPEDAKRVLDLLIDTRIVEK